ncbi:MAG: YfiR family protein [Lentisphaerae bacterium]|nr:YfiR family protein [Lentisphaerota bacterium]
MVLPACALFLLALRVPAEPPREFHEHDIKAAFLFRFLQLVEWPPDTFATDDSPIIVGILGQDPFGNVLADTVRGETINGRSIVVREGAKMHDLLPCHLLFVPSASVNASALPLPVPSPAGVLLVGEGQDFIQQGGMIRFYLDGNRVRFEICPEAAEQSRIRIRSRLLRLARIVECAPPVEP